MMTQAAEKHRYTVDEYLRIERDSRDKHEYHDGEILAMSGGTPPHSLISSNVSGELRGRLKGKRCRVYESNLRICIPSENRYVYADASVICGPVQYDPADTKQETVTNPRVIVEVLSPSTEGYDRTTTFDSYRKLQSMEEYVLVSQDSPTVAIFSRQADGGWLFYPSEGIEAIAKLRSIQVELPLTEIYAGVEFPPEPPPPTAQ
jgi:Uma2 family endonuclease